MINKWKRLMSAVLCGIMLSATIITAFTDDGPFNGEGNESSVTPSFLFVCGDTTTEMRQ